MLKTNKDNIIKPYDINTYKDKIDVHFSRFSSSKIISTRKHLFCWKIEVLWSSDTARNLYIRPVSCAPPHLPDQVLVCLSPSLTQQTTLTRPVKRISRHSAWHAYERLHRWETVFPSSRLRVCTCNGYIVTSAIILWFRLRHPMVRATMPEVVQDQRNCPARYL